MKSILYAAALLLLGQAGSESILEDSKTDFVLKNQTGGAHFRGGKTSFDMGGSPVMVQKNSSGFQLTSLHLTGVYFKQADGTYNFDSLEAKGNAEAIFDSNKAIAFAKANKLTTTDEPDTHTDLKSENLVMAQKPYSDDAFTQITATLDNPFTIHDDRKGRLKPPEKSKELGDPFTRDSTYTGSSGTFTFKAPKKKGGVAKLLKGESNGPIHFHSTQTIFAKSADAPVKKEFDVTADHLDADMSKSADQIILKGHVVFSYSDDGLHGNCNEIRVSVDDDGNITGYQTLGEPATVTATPDEKKH